MLLPGGKIPDDEVMFALELTNLCTALHSLPRPGGILDQDYYHIALLTAGLHGRSKLQEKQNKEAEDRARRQRH